MVRYKQIADVRGAVAGQVSAIAPRGANNPTIKNQEPVDLAGYEPLDEDMSSMQRGEGSSSQALGKSLQMSGDTNA